MGRYRNPVLLISIALAALVAVGRLASIERPAHGDHAARTGRAAASATREEAAPTVPVAQVSARLEPAVSVERAPAPAPAAPPRDVPRSLRDTDVDGAVLVDGRGDLVVGPELLALFDYFLSAAGEEPSAALKARIVAAIRKRATGPAADQAIAMLDRYLAYREAGARMHVEDEADPAARLAALRELRREHFGEADATLLFGDEEREGEVAIERARILADATLSPEERDARLAEVEATLPEEIRAAREAAMRPLLQQAEELSLRAAGASDEEIHAHRLATVGPEAAERLAELDRQRAAWQKRLDAFADARAQLEATVADPDERRAAAEALLERDFTPEERLRVRALLGPLP